MRLSGVLCVLCAVALAFLPGCALSAFPKEFGETTKATAVSITDQARWERVLARLSGHVNNPGLRTEVGVTYFLEARLVGVDGDVQLEGDGTGGELSQDARAKLLRLFSERPEAVILFEQLLDKLDAEKGEADEAQGARDRPSESQ